MTRVVLVAAACLILLLLGWFVWRKGRPADQASLPPAADEAFEDFLFTIVGSETMPDGGRRLQLRLPDDSPLTLDVALSHMWFEGRLGDTDIQTFQGVVTFFPPTLGSRSFVAELEARYRTGLVPTASPGPTVFTGISLEGNPADLESGPTKIKLFYEPDSEAAYAEVYLNIDLAQGFAEFAEKDLEYRVNLVRAFSQR